MNTNIFSIDEEDELVLSEDFFADFDEPVETKTANTSRGQQEQIETASTSFQSTNDNGGNKVRKFMFKPKTSPAIPCVASKIARLQQPSQEHDLITTNIPVGNETEKSSLQKNSGDSSLISQRKNCLSNLAHLKRKENLSSEDHIKNGNVQQLRGIGDVSQKQTSDKNFSRRQQIGRQFGAREETSLSRKNPASASPQINSELGVCTSSVQNSTHSLQLNVIKTTVLSGRIGEGNTEKEKEFSNEGVNEVTSNISKQLNTSPGLTSNDPIPSKNLNIPKRTQFQSFQKSQAPTSNFAPGTQIHTDHKKSCTEVPFVSNNGAADQRTNSGTGSEESMQPTQTRGFQQFVPAGKSTTQFQTFQAKKQFGANPASCSGGLSTLPNEKLHSTLPNEKLHPKSAHGQFQKSTSMNNNYITSVSEVQSSSTKVPNRPTTPNNQERVVTEKPASSNLSRGLRPIGQFASSPVSVNSVSQFGPSNSNNAMNSSHSAQAGTSPRLSSPNIPTPRQNSTVGLSNSSSGFIRPPEPATYNRYQSPSPGPSNFRQRTPGSGYGTQFPRNGTSAFSSVGGNTTPRHQGPVRHAGPALGQRFRTPVPPSPAENVPVLTPGVARQLCRTPSGSGSGAQARSRTRKFPGPAGILPKLEPGENLSAAKLAQNKEKVDEEKKSKEEPQCSQDTSVDDFTIGAWKAMKTELGIKDDDQSSILAKYNIDHVIRKASLKQLSRNKVPYICVMIKTITVNASDASVTLKDPTGEMLGTLHRRLVEEHQSELRPGCVLVLQKVGVLSPSLRNHYLNVTLNNVVQVFASDVASNQKTPPSQKKNRKITQGSPCETSPNGSTSPGGSNSQGGLTSPLNSNNETNSPQTKSVRTNLLPELTSVTDEHKEQKREEEIRRKNSKRNSGAKDENPPKKVCLDKAERDLSTEKDDLIKDTSRKSKDKSRESKDTSRESKDKLRESKDKSRESKGTSRESSPADAKEDCKEDSLARRLCLDKTKDANETSEGVVTTSEKKILTMTKELSEEHLAALIEGFEEEIFADF